MFCINCGKQFQGEGYLCPECVKAKTGSAPAAPQAAEEPVLTPPAAPQIPEAPVYTAPVAPRIPEEPVYIPPVYQQPVQPEAQAAYQPVATATAYAPAAEQSAGQTPGFTLGTPVGDKKKKNVGVVILAIVLALALVGGAVALVMNWDKLFTRVPEDPAEYVAFLEEPRMQLVTDNLTQAYGKWLESAGSGASVDMDMKLYLGNDLLSILSQVMASEGMPQMDMKWLQEITLRLHTNTPDDLSAAEFGLEVLLGDTSLVSLDSAMDLEEFILYLVVPELNGTALKLDYQQLMDQQGVVLPVDQLMALSAQLAKDMPDQEAVATLANGCKDILLSYLTEAEKDTQTLTVGEAEQEATVLTVTLTEKQLAQMVQELLEYIQEDDAARQAVQAFVNYSNEVNALIGTGETVSEADFDAFLEEGIDAMKRAAKEAGKGNYLQLVTYADGRNILGRSFQMFDDGEAEGEIYYASLTQEDVVYFEARMAEEVRITGEGQLKKELLSGEYLLSVEGENALTLELKNVDPATGWGSYILSPEPELLARMELDSMVSTLATSFAIRLDLQENGGKLSLVTGKTTLVSLELGAVIGEGKQVTLPADAVELTDEAALAQWIREVRLDKLARSLKDAGLPQELQALVDALVQQWNAQMAGS